MTRIAIFVFCLAAILATSWPVGSALAAGGVPMLEGLSASEITERTAKLGALINPDGSRTTYQLWVEYAPCQGGAGECPNPPVIEKVGKGKIAPGDQGVAVSRNLKMLTPGCHYTYWFVATNSFGTAQSSREQVKSAGKESFTCRR
jgi:hypothetical protein